MKITVVSSPKVKFVEAISGVFREEFGFTKIESNRWGLRVYHSHIERLRDDVSIMIEAPYVDKVYRDVLAMS